MPSVGLIIVDHGNIALEMMDSRIAPMAIALRYVVLWTWIETAPIH